MDVNVIGRVNNINLPQTNAMLPVFEALINSIHAIKEVDNSDKKITIKIIRDESQDTIFDDNESSYFKPIKDIIVIDNGIGFNHVNYNSFLTSDTTKKRAIGGKGIGRFLWLKAFENVEITSVYKENEKLNKRRFIFSLSEKAISNEINTTDIKEDVQTIVELKFLKPEYHKFFPKKLNTIAFRILEHILSYYILDDPLNIIIEDTSSKEFINLNQLFSDEIKPNIINKVIKIKDFDFKITLIKLFSSMESIHKVFYCAHGREVKNENIRELLPLLDHKLTDSNDRQFVVLVFVSSEYLDKNVNQERTNFNFLENESLFPETITFMQIRNTICTTISDILQEYIKPIRDKHLKRITNFIHSENPEYRPILTYNIESLEKIPPNITDDKLELELHKINHDIENDVKRMSQEILKLGKADDIDQEYKDKFDLLLQKVNDVNMSKLAEYIIHRRIILELFKKRLQKMNHEQYSLEESIHELIVPLKISSNDDEYLKQNLWLIDERLSYHYHLSSDLSLIKNPVTLSKSKSRPDILIFNQPHAFVEEEIPYSSIVIIEFKRPERNDYSENDNPITQVQNYIREIQNGNVKDTNGRTIQISKTTPFYGYIICDINDKIRLFAENATLIKTPDDMGYFGFNQNLNAYIEILSFDKMLIDARKRNKVLFDKLGLSSTWVNKIESENVNNISVDGVLS